MPLFCVGVYCFITSEDKIDKSEIPATFNKSDYVDNRILDSQNDVILSINKSLDRLKSVAHKDVRISYNGIGLVGDMVFEKDNNFRCLIYSGLGLESDMGSNKDLFWFWSKRSNPQIMYYGKHINLPKSKLKGEMSPKWAIMVLNLRKLNEKAVCVYKKDKLYIVESEDKYTYVTLVDPNRKLMLAHYIYDSDGSIIAGSTNYNFHNVNGMYLPKRILIAWYKEGITVSWTFNQPTANPSPSEKAFVMPDYEPKSEL